MPCSEERMDLLGATPTPTLPEPGWGHNALGQLIYTQVGGDYLMADPPKRDGYVPFFVAKHTGYCRWTYKAVTGGPQ